MSLNRDELAASALAMGVGAAVVFLRSIIDGKRRTVAVLLAGCAFGAFGAWIAWQITGPDSKWAWLAVGLSAILAENVVIAVYRLGEKLANDPEGFLSWLAGIWKAARGGS